MRQQQKVIALSLALAILVSLFTACSSSMMNDNSVTDTQSADTAAVSQDPSEIPRELMPDSLPDDLDLGGASIRIASVLAYRQEISPEDSSEIVDSAVYNRNIKVEDRLNMKIEPLFYDVGTQVLGPMIKNSVMADSDDYDIVANAMWVSLPQMLDGIYRDLSSSSYLDLSQPWWYEEFINELRVGKDKLFFLSGDVSITSIYRMSTVFFNKTMIQDYGVTPDDMYNLVLDGKWTYDKLSEMARQAYRDVNNNNERDQDDVYGFYINPFSDPEHFAYTAGNKMSYRDEYGYPVLNVLTDKFADYMSMFYDLCFNNEGVYPIKEDNQAYPIQRFNDGYALFLTYRLLACLSLRDMKDEYGIIPYPKYTEEQKSYLSIIHDNATVWCIPTTCGKFDEVTAVIEAMCAENYRSVIPVLYEVALKVKYTSDNTAAAMIDIIRDSVITDFAYAYNYALSNAGLICRLMIQGRISELASMWKRLESGANRGLEKIINYYTSLD